MLNTLIEKLDNPSKIDLNRIDQLFEEYFVDFGLSSSTLISYLLNQSGKKLRPLILLISSEIAGNVCELSYKCATIFEALHTASLIHDDIIDLAELRRGENSVNHEFGNKLAVLAGDFLLSRSLFVLAQDASAEIIRIYANTSEQLCLGEIREQQGKNGGEISKEEYFEIIKMKTASLFSSCSEVGVLAGNGSIDLQEKMRLYGEYFGIAFQLKDDLLDFLGDIDEIGKEVGKDSAENILTFPLLSIMDNISIEIEDLQKYEFSQLKSLIQDNSGFKKTEKEIAKYSQKCFDILDQLDQSKEVILLKEIVKLNIERKS